LNQEGVELNHVPLGPMIEVPGAALVVDALAKESDFLAVGTNDLVQYTLAVDRGNKAVSHLHQPWHPAVLRLVREIVLAGKRETIPVSLCGEMASDPLGALTLLGLGLTRFSCNIGVIPEIRAVLRHTSEAHAREVVASAMGRACTEEVREVLLEGFGRVMQEVLGSDISGEVHRHGFTGY